MDRLQADILNQGLKENSYLRPHSIPILNNQLNTIQKDSIIKAINELHMKMSIVDRSISNFMSELLEIIGNWKNNPDLKDGLNLMAGSLIESLIYLHNLVGVGGLKRTAVFYVQKYIGVERFVEIFIPYKGRMDRLYLSIPRSSTEDLSCILTIGEKSFEITLPAGESMVYLDLDGIVNNESVKLTVLNGEVGLEGINASLDFIQE